MIKNIFSLEKNMRFKILDINGTKFSITEAFVDISLIVGLFIVISTELLSLFNFINKYSLIAIWIIFILYLYFKISSHLKNYKITIRNYLNFFF